jgi:multisubunit Na+/H+ antiporter MnhB subunit
MTSGSDPKKREDAKNMAMYVIIGLIVIWAAPLIVNWIVG